MRAEGILIGEGKDHVLEDASDNGARNITSANAIFLRDISNLGFHRMAGTKYLLAPSVSSTILTAEDHPRNSKPQTNFTGT